MGYDLPKETGSAEQTNDGDVMSIVQNSAVRNLQAIYVVKRHCRNFEVNKCDFRYHYIRILVAMHSYVRGRFVVRLERKVERLLTSD